jgi:tRNA 2-thiouridine synthesizing protein A
MVTVDARGLSCPEPILRMKRGMKQLAAGEQLEVLVETVTSRENVRRAAEAQKWQVTSEATTDGFRLVIAK